MRGRKKEDEQETEKGKESKKGEEKDKESKEGEENEKESNKGEEEEKAIMRERIIPGSFRRQAAVSGHPS